MALPITLIVVGFLVTLTSRIALQRARCGPACPLCGGGVLRWTEARLVSGPDGRPHDVIEAGQCPRCAARIYQSHRSGWWRVNAFDGSASVLAFSSPLSWRAGRRHWRRLDRATSPVIRLCSLAGVPWLAGTGVVLGLASMVAGVCMPMDPPSDTAPRTAALPTAIRQPAPIELEPPPYDPAAASLSWEEEELDPPPPLLPRSNSVTPRPRSIPQLGMQIALDPSWELGETRHAGGGTLVNLVRRVPDAEVSIVLGSAPFSIEMGATPDEASQAALGAAIDSSRRMFGSNGPMDCRIENRRHVCTTVSPDGGVLTVGWGWAEGDRVVLAVALFVKPQPERVREVEAAVRSIQFLY